MIVAVAVVVIFVGIGVGMSGVPQETPRPEIEQQGKMQYTNSGGITNTNLETKEMISENVQEKPKVKNLGDNLTEFKKSAEICGDGLDNDFNGKIDEPSTSPGPGVNWSKCDL